MSNIKLTDDSLESKSFPHEDFIAGIPPFLRGIDSTMFVNKSLETKNITDFSVLKEYKVNSIDDFKNSWNLDFLKKKDVSISMDKNLLPTFAFLIAGAQKFGVALNSIKGIFENDFSGDISEKHIIDVLKFTRFEMPSFNSIMFSNEQIITSETGVESELAYMLIQSINFIKKGINNGLDIDYLASKISFSFISETDIFKEMAKIRAVRMLWSKLIKQLEPKHEDSLALKINYVINKTDSNEDRLNAISKETLKSMSAYFGGAQNLLTDYSDKKRTLFLELESGISKTVDPWGGSYYLEELTQNITIKTWELIEKIEQNEGEAIEKNILEISFKKKKNQKKESELIEKESITNVELNRVESEVNKVLRNLASCVKNGEGNLLDLTIKSVKKRATLSEITNILQHD